MKYLIVVLLPALALGQLGLPGGIVDTTVEASYEPVVFAVNAAKTYLLGLDSTHGTYSLVEIVSARSQVVAGQNLYLTLHLTGDYFCDVTVWYRSWLQGPERLQVTSGPTCRKHTARQILAGGVSAPKPVPQSALSTEDSVLLQALAFAACSYNVRTNSMFSSVLGDTAGATYTQQVTSGMTYRFQHVPLQTTHCRNHISTCPDASLQSCNVNHDGMKVVCSFTVQSQPWMTPSFTLSDVACV